MGNLIKTTRLPDSVARFLSIIPPPSYLAPGLLVSFHTFKNVFSFMGTGSISKENGTSPVLQPGNQIPMYARSAQCKDYPTHARLTSQRCIHT